MAKRPQSNKPKKLTERQRKFVLYYEGNATQAAIKAGYSEKTAGTMGGNLMKNPLIRDAIKKKQAPKETKHIMSVAARKERLTEIANAGEVECVCKLCGGRFTIVRSENDAIKALDVLNKMEAVYVKKIEMSGHLNHVVYDLSRLSETDLDELERIVAMVEPVDAGPNTDS